MLHFKKLVVQRFWWFTISELYFKKPFGQMYGFFCAIWYQMSKKASQRFFRIPLKELASTQKNMFVRSIFLTVM